VVVDDNDADDNDDDVCANFRQSATELPGGSVSSTRARRRGQLDSIKLSLAASKVRSRTVACYAERHHPFARTSRLKYESGYLSDLRVRIPAHSEDTSNRVTIASHS